MFDPSQSVLAGIPAATLQTMLASAQAALADLYSGAKVVTVSYTQGDGAKSVSFTQASIGSLTNWIMLLNTALGTSRNPRRPMRPYFR